MLERRSLTGPVALGVVMIVLVIVLATIWILQNVLGASGDYSSSTWFWVGLATGSLLLAAVLAGVIAYLTLTVKAINLNRRQSNFIDAVTHELKSPIASLKLYLQTMSRRTVDQQQVEDFHRIMLEDVERLDALINHLLDAARINADGQQRTGNRIDSQTVQLDQLLRQCASAACIRYRLPPEIVRIESEPISVRAPLVQLEIVFRNLIDNAVKYAGTPPVVRVTATRQGETEVRISIADNGSGIPANQRRKIFGRFIRLGSELERSKPGTGLGLYLVRNVVKSLGGAIRIQGAEQETGTEFEVTLPGVTHAAAHPSRRR